MEIAHWYDWRSPTGSDTSGQRVYFGHETCQQLLPTPGAARELARRLRDSGKSVTLVVPYLTEAGLRDSVRLIEGLLTQDASLEVVSSDWGLLHEIGRRGLGSPVVGRLLSGQLTDPRLARIMDVNRRRQPRPVRHLDGTVCQLQYIPPSLAMANRIRSCGLDRPEIIGFLKALGIRRCELSNISQGMELASIPGWSYSLHIPDVLITVMRRCPGSGEDFASAEHRCTDKVTPSCHGEPRAWEMPGINATVFRRDNALYYRQPNLPTNLQQLPIDRLVHRIGRQRDHDSINR
ncbi:MAG TPA: hypothetical protein PLU30_20455 [Verrucomicrobiae bacterium]|nr:hypothetical protein [Verrucomicrobiae bacterium]